MDQILPYGDRGPFHCLPYDDRGPGVFDLVARRIRQTNPWLVVEHVGSTAVPNCPGKGFIDVLVMVPSVEDLTDASIAVQRVGFVEHDYGQGYPGARGAVKVDGALFRIHIQIVPRDSQKAEEMIAFRELLRHDPDLVARYARQKQALIESGHDRNPEYTAGKTELIQSALCSRRGMTMVTLRIEHRVPNYDAWKRAFDSDPAGRKQSGVLRYSILRGIDEPSYVMIDLDVESRDDAEGLLATMRHVWGAVQGSIIDEPHARIVERVETVEL